MADEPAGLPQARRSRHTARADQVPQRSQRLHPRARRGGHARILLPHREPEGTRQRRAGRAGARRDAGRVSRSRRAGLRCRLLLRRSARHADDAARRQGPRVPAGLPRRHGGGPLPQLAHAGRSQRPRRGAPPLLRRHDPRDGHAGHDPRPLSPPLRLRHAGRQHPFALPRRGAVAPDRRPRQPRRRARNSPARAYATPYPQRNRFGRPADADDASSATTATRTRTRARSSSSDNRRAAEQVLHHARRSRLAPGLGGGLRRQHRELLRRPRTEVPRAPNSTFPSPPARPACARDRACATRNTAKEPSFVAKAMGMTRRLQYNFNSTA